jgi:SAM-dependent methyltransferase
MPSSAKSRAVGHDAQVPQGDDERAAQRELVRRGYDTVSYSYRPDTDALSDAEPEGLAAYRTWVNELGVFLRTGDRVLDLGCGAGIPAAKLLADAGFEVVGVDFSEVQIARAQALVPNATFVCADMVHWVCDPSTFDAVVSFYALIHLPAADQRPLLSRIARWLRPNGYLLATVGHRAWTGIEDYLGAPMFWDHADDVTYLSWFTEAGLIPRWHRFIPEGDSGHTLVLAQRQ